MEKDVGVQKIGKFVADNKYYVTRLGIIVACILGSNVFIIIFSKTIDHNLIGNTWVIGSCVLTALYTRWFWFRKEGEGEKILHNIKEKINGQADSIDYKVRCSLRIGVSVVLLVLVVVVTVVVTIMEKCFDYSFKICQLGSWGNISNSDVSVGLTLLLMIITYHIFCWTDKTIIKYYNPKKEEDCVVSDFRYTFHNSDRPGFFTFVFFGIYFLVIYPFTNDSINLFFYGMIAFQMFVSSIIGANTVVTNATQHNS